MMKLMNNPGALFKKTALIIFGFFLAIVVLELGLRCAGFFIVLSQEVRNVASAQQRGAYRIMCLGESTTQGQYPAFLEKALNRKKCGIPFSVIDKGVIGTTSRTILAQLEGNLNEVKPDMVVVMMGINDGAYHMIYKVFPDSPWSNLKIYHLVQWLKLGFFSKVGCPGDVSLSGDDRIESPGIQQGQTESFKDADQIQSTLPEGVDADQDIDKAHIELGWVYRDQGKISLAQAQRVYVKATQHYPKDDQAWIALGQVYREQGRVREAFQSFNKAKQLNAKYNQKVWSLIEKAWIYRDAGRFPEAIDFLQRAIALAGRDEWVYINLGWVYRDQGRFDLAEMAFKRAIALNPKNNWAYIKLGQVYRDEGKLSSSQAIAAFKKAIAINPDDDWAFVNLGWVYRDQGEYFLAEEAFKKAIVINSVNNEAYLGLGWVYSIQSKLTEAEAAFKKASRFEPLNEDVFIGLGQVYRDQRKYLLAEEAFKKAIAINPGNDEAYINLGWLYRNNGNLKEAEKILKKAILVNPNYDRIYGLLAAIYRQTGQTKLEKYYARKARDMRQIFYNPVTISSYQSLKAALDKRRILLVCVQYPMHSVASLKKIFEGQEGVLFVDNEKVFKEAVRRDGYKKYFWDMFGGDFGHCTTAGNELLAENIARTILKNVFHR